MNIVFVHGWGCGPEVWTSIIEQLDYSLKISCVNLGFFQTPDNQDNLPEDALYVCHSLGVQWFLKHGPKRPKGLVSIAGFDRFTPHINPRIVMAMQKNLERNPKLLLNSFWQNCGVANYKPLSEPNQDKLMEGLEWLKSWDATKELARLACPRQVLAARDDKIVPAEMTEAIWQGSPISWSETGGHMLPINRPKWVTEKIKEFINALK